ncbi:MAG: aldehyde oxidase, partial [Gemmatimonadota bacterium]|nr:aldehyde oxidase [Gemmatimonadota bacterium]
MASVGRSVARREGRDKVTGSARYTDDLEFPGAWLGRTVRSTIPKGELESLTFDRAFDWSQVVVVTPRDIPGENVVQLIEN